MIGPLAGADPKISKAFTLLFSPLQCHKNIFSLLKSVRMFCMHRQSIPLLKLYRSSNNFSQSPCSKKKLEVGIARQVHEVMDVCIAVAEHVPKVLKELDAQNCVPVRTPMSIFANQTINVCKEMMYRTVMCLVNTLHHKQAAYLAIIYWRKESLVVWCSPQCSPNIPS